jgi:hypothetical protein
LYQLKYLGCENGRIENNGALLFTAAVKDIITFSNNNHNKGGKNESNRNNKSLRFLFYVISNTLF